MEFTRRSMCALFIAWLAAAPGLFAQDAPATKSSARQYPDPRKFESNIAAFEARDQKAMPPKGAIVCTGSSSMVGWHPTIAQDLAPLTVIPRGFGGSNFNDVLHFADRVIINYQPRAILLYAGDNDIAQGIAPEKIRDTFKALVEKVRKSLPEVRIYVIAIKPSPKREAMWPRALQANKLLEAACREGDRLTFIDIAPGMMDAGGKIREDIFKADRLHMNAQGYEVWKGIIRPVLMKQEAQFEKAGAGK